MSQEAETVEQVCGFFHNRLNMAGGHWSPFLEYRHNHGDEDDLVVYILKTFEEFSTRAESANKREIAAKKDEIEKIRSIAKRLADVMDTRIFCRNDCKKCSIGKYENKECSIGKDENIVCLQRRDRKLIAKAREACK